MLVYDFQWSKQNNNGLLAHSQKSFFDFGYFYPLYMKKNAWRFFNCLFMHANMLHLVLSSLLKIYSLSFIENKIGRNKAAMLYFISSIGGVALAALITDEPGVAGSAGVGMISFSLYLESACF